MLTSRKAHGADKDKGLLFCLLIRGALTGILNLHNAVLTGNQIGLTENQKQALTITIIIANGVWRLSDIESNSSEVAVICYDMATIFPTKRRNQF